MYYKVFLDTNIYEGTNFSFRNATFNSLRDKVAADKAELHINSVVEGEVKQHINEKIKQAAKGLLNAVKVQSLAGFLKYPDYKDHLMIPDPNDWVQKSLDEFEQLLKDCKAKHTSSNDIDVEGMLADYFSNPQVAPFEAKKPEEFKDAITVRAIANEVKTLKEGETYVVISADKGFNQAVKEKIGDKVLSYGGLPDFLSYLTQKYTVAFQKYLQTDDAKEEIIEAIKQTVENASFSIDDKPGLYAVDDTDVIDIEDFEYKTSIIDIDEKVAKVSVDANCSATIWFQYTDDDESYWDREDHAYLWQKIREYQDKYKLEFSIVITFDISEWSAEDGGDITFLDYEDMPTQFDLDEDNLIESEELTEPEYKDEGYSTCPDCGRPITVENDGGNGFCVDCAKNH